MRYIAFYRCEIIEKRDLTKDFLKTLEKEWPALLIHDFLAKSQGAYLSKKKENIDNGEFVVCLDFAENYSFHIQDAIQAHHWSNSQATLHPYIIYYRENEKRKHLNYVVISEKVTHDSSAVHLFNSKLIKFLKSKFPDNTIQKIVYFSDGAVSQYKNKFNFINLAKHYTDFGVFAEWNFFATSHGKGACDGVGGTVKRQAYRASLQRVNNNQHITNPQQLFEWASKAFKNVEFGFCTNEDHELHEQS